MMYQEELIDPDYRKIGLAPLPYGLVTSTFLQYAPEENLVCCTVCLVGLSLF